MEGTSKDSSFTWPYQFPNIRDENHSRWAEVEKNLNDPRFQAATARIFGERRPVNPCVRSALKRRFDLENSQSTNLHGSPHKKSRLASVATTSSESEQFSISTCDSACGCNSQSNGREWQSLCKRILSIREKLQSVPEMNSSFDQRVRELSDKAKCTYDWLQNVIPPSRSHSENSCDLQDVSDCSSNASPDASSCSDIDFSHNEGHQPSDKSENCAEDGHDQTMLKNLVSPTYAENVENIAVYGKKVLITLRESPQEILSASLSSTQLNESSSEHCKSLTAPVSKLPDHITDYDSYKSSVASPLNQQVGLSNYEAENLTNANPEESCLSFNKDLTHYFSCDPVKESSVYPSVSCNNDINSHIKLEEMLDQETEEACSEAESPETSDDTNSVHSDSSESEDPTESDSQISDTSTHSSDSEEEYSAMLSDDEVSDSCREFISTLRNGKCEDNLQSDLPETEPPTDSDTSDSEASVTFIESSPCSRPPKRCAVPYNGGSLPMPDLMTYVVTSVPVLSLNKLDLMHHRSNSSFKKKKDEFQKVQSRVQLCKRALLLILKERLCKEVKVVLPRLPDYIYKAHLQSKPIMLKNISPLISQVKSLNI